MSLRSKVVLLNVRGTLRVFSVVILIGSLFSSSLALPEVPIASIVETLQKASNTGNDGGAGGAFLSLATVANSSSYESLLGALFSSDVARNTRKLPTLNRIEIRPANRTVLQGETFDFSATAYEGEQPVSGIIFSWTIVKMGSQQPRRLLNGRFEAQIPGRYIVTASAGGFSANTSFTVVANPGYKYLRLLKKPEAERTDAERELIAQWIARRELTLRSVSSRENNSAAVKGSPDETRRSTQQPLESPSSVDPIGWDSTNYGTADDPVNWVGRVNGAASQKGAANGNYNLTVPAVNLDGRGALDINLNLEYNSRLWSKSGTEMTYNADSGYPAPGWNLGFGKMFNMGNPGGCMLVAPDGTRRSYDGSISISGYGHTFTGYTTDGSLIDYSCSYYSVGGNTSLTGWAKYPDGTTVTFNSPTVNYDQTFPVKIRDAHGNIVDVSYVNNEGPAINTITDTLGRTITFNYNGTALRSISGPGYNNTTRYFIRIEYFHQTIATTGMFNSGLTVNVANTTPYQIKAIYYPTTDNGFWLCGSNYYSPCGTDSYSPYGIIRRIISKRGMSWNSGTDTIEPGTTNRDEVYNFPTSPNSSLTDSPGYSTHTETFDGIDTSSLVTSFSTNTSGAEETITVVRPDGSKLIQKSHVTSTFSNGLQFENRIESPSSTVLDKTVTTLEQGAYSSHRPTSIEHTDDKSQITKTEFIYGSVYNQVSSVKSYDYPGNVLYREKRFTYENGSLYTNNHIFNLVKTAEDYDNSNTRLTRTVYSYDGGTLVAASGIVQHDYTFDPYTTETVNGSCLVWNPAGAGCTYEGEKVDVGGNTYFCACETYEQVSAFNWLTAYRGNLTNVTTYTDGQNATGAISHDFTYDIAGNQRTATADCCQQIASSYSIATQYLLPDSVTKGSSSENITQSFSYDANTKVPTRITDFNGLLTDISYDYSLRPTVVTFPYVSGSGSSSVGKKTTTYGDSTLSQTEHVQKADNTTVSQSIAYFNGRGQVNKSTYQAGASNWNGTQIKYDTMGRQWKVSMPYDTSSSPSFWSETAYDYLSRPIWQMAADGSTSTMTYNPTAPSGGSSSSGQSVTSKDAWGRERWVRYDAFGRLVEVVEPDPANTGGSLNIAGGYTNLQTTYAYDRLDRLTTITQGSQTRSFAYDSLGRMTRQKLAEQAASINDSGIYNSGTLIWSDAFVYDSRGNITQRTDARGVKTNFNYLVSGSPDPLNRLQGITYDTSTADTTYTINAAPAVTFEYMTTGDKTRVTKVIASGVSTEENTFDSQGRISDYILTLDAHTSKEFKTTYTYDTANRLTQIDYPKQWGWSGDPRKAVVPSYDQASRLTQMTIGGTTALSDVSYNTSSQVTQLKTGAGTSHPRIEGYSYEAQTGLLTGQTVKNTALTSTYLDLSYTYDRGGSFGTGSGGKTGQLTKIADNLDHNRDKLYEFDSLGRIRNAKGGIAAGASGVTANWTQSYSYDRYGNKTGVTASGVDQNSASIPADGLTSVTASTSTNRITDSGWDYDKTGNLIRGQNTSGIWQRFEYDAAGRLKKVKDDSNTVLQTYTYGAGREKLIVSDGSNTNYYVWGGSQIIAEYGLKSGNPKYSKGYFYAGSRLLMTETKGKTYDTIEYHHPDRLGTQLVTDTSAGTSYRQTTLPFGTGIPAETTGNTNQVFTSYDRSSMTGLDYAVNRTYSKGQGRFTQVDPIAMASASLGNPQSNNLYAYTQNMPTDFVDPSGLQSVPFTMTYCLPWDGGPRICVEVVVHWMNTGGSVGSPLTGGGGGDTPYPRGPDAKNCGKLAEFIKAVRDELAKRGSDLIQDLLGLDPGPGPMTISGHADKFRERQGVLRKALNAFDENDCRRGPGHRLPGDAWEWATNPTPKNSWRRLPANGNRMVEVAGGVVVTAATAYVIYRIVRMVPSLAPPLWPTLPVNLAVP